MTAKLPKRLPPKAAAIISLRKSNPTMTLTAIGKEVGVSDSYVGRILRQHAPELLPKRGR